MNKEKCKYLIGKANGVRSCTIIKSRPPIPCQDVQPCPLDLCAAGQAMKKKELEFLLDDCSGYYWICPEFHCRQLLKKRGFTTTKRVAINSAHAFAKKVGREAKFK